MRIKDLKSLLSKMTGMITDQTMPQMTGVELAGEILRIRPRMPIAPYRLVVTMFCRRGES
jgi:hypothetical protein